ncbi:hypothetical protein DL93DRAFT_2158473 [Clavulina sp. PMI_390]|nr:hypothetical protein DL93DRAFT_2158473 [Clavulina sp. PMI_390]
MSSSATLRASHLSRRSLHTSPHHSLVVRPRAFNRTRARWNSTSTGASRSGDATGYLFAGAAGGGLVLLGGYAYYHFSGLKTAVNSARSVKDSFVSAKDSFVNSTPAPNEAIQYLRDFTKRYVAIIPGASGYVDKTFDELDKLSQSHGPEVQKLVEDTTRELKDAVQGGQVDLPTAQKVVSILTKRGEQLTQLAAKASSGSIQKLLDEHPEVKEKLGKGWDDLKNLAEKGGEQGEEAKKLVEETTKQVVALFKDGFSPDSISKARDLLKQKTDEARKIADNGAKQAYNKALEAAQPYLEKVPDVQQMITDNASLLGSSSAGASAAAIWSAVKSAVDGKKGKIDQDKLKELVNGKIEEAKEAAKSLGGEASEGLGDKWEGLQGWLKGVVPEEVQQKIPDLSALASVARDNSEDAQNLVKGTYEEVLEVLRKKAEEAKKLAEGAKEDVKEKSGKDDEGKKQKKQKN